MRTRSSRAHRRICRAAAQRIHIKGRHGRIHFAIAGLDCFPALRTGPSVHSRSGVPRYNTTSPEPPLRNNMPTQAGPIRHSWKLTPRAAVTLQRALASRVIEAPLSRPARYIAGGDCAFVRGGASILVGWVVWDTFESRVVEQVVLTRRCSFPYVPGLLSFREAPAMIAAAQRLKTVVDVYMIDGQGRAHPRRIGLASHVGLWLDRPTVGCAKSRLCGEYVEPGARRRASRPLLDGREVIGRVLRTRDGVRPLFISVGHRITLGDAVRCVLSSGGRYRLPEPTRRAHQLVTHYKAQHFLKG